MIKPLRDKVFLEYKKEKKQKGGIVTSDVSKDKPATMTVIAIGPEVKEVKKGDVVVFDPFIPRSLNVEGREIFIINEKNIDGTTSTN